jgi:CheY-like chemotaxis protein
LVIVEPVTETILLVNDDVIVRTALAHYLRDCGYRVVEAVNADEALAVLSHPNVKIDVVFSDLRMPGSLDGFGLSRWVRNHRPEVDMILAATDDRAADAAADVCAAGTLPKPYDPQGLLDRIKRLRAARDHQR